LPREGQTLERHHDVPSDAAKQKTLWELTRGQRARYASAILVMWLGFLFLFGVPIVARAAIDGVVAPEGEEPEVWRLLGIESPVARLVWAGVAVVALTTVSGVFLYLRGRWAAMASENIVRGVRNRLYRHLAELPCSYHDGAETGDLVQRCTSDVDTIRVFLSGQVVEIGRAVLLLLTAVPLLIWLDPGLALVSVALYPVIITFAVIFFGRVKTIFRLADEAEGEMTAVLQENLTGIRVVRAFARQDFECSKFADKNEQFRDRGFRLIRLLGTYWSVSDVLCLGQIGLILIVGAQWMSRGALSVGDLFAFLTCTSIVIWPVRHLGRVLVDTGKAIVSLRRLREILAVPAESDLDAAGDGAPREISGALEIEGLAFAYDGSGPVLSDLSLSIRPGETVALLGPPGAGKSTLVQLLLRLYDYETGSIRLDGRELRTLGRRFVRSRVGVVLQEPFLYSKTVGSNVRVGRAEATDQEVVASTSAACVHGSIQEFDQAYETLVGERGVTLSGGQRQRLALARALIKDPDILVLDDALSAVDTETEARILEALEERKGRRTTILIAHRLSSILQSDRVFVLEHGRIVQQGRHEDLMAENGPYRRLWRIQGALEDELGDDLRMAAAGKDRS
jgi:ATP-binding cassette subfamily B protein